MNIAITGVGGGVGQSILKALNQSNYNIVTLDGDYMAAGLYANKKSYKIPYASSNEFIPILLDICEKENISLLFPGLDAELMKLSKNKHLFEKIGTTVVVSRSEVISIAEDKQETYDALSEAKFSVPYTRAAESFKPEEDEFPIILKQKVGGARSQNVFLIRNTEEWYQVISGIGNISDFVAMTYIEGDEYTCGTINLLEGCKGVIIMKRILRDGDTHKAFVVKNDIIENEVIRLMDFLKPFGACNVQLRMKDDVPYIFEINARCSGTTAARALSGFNEPKMIADFLIHGIEPKFSIQEQTILRYWKELVVDNNDIEDFKRNDFLKNPSNLKKL